MTIGIVAEGYRDHDIIEAIADMLYPGCNFRPLQPEPVAVDGSTYGGYKGVWQWCIQSKAIVDGLSKISSHTVDKYIIHLDGDTIREKNLYCDNSSICTVSASSSPAYCRKSFNECPIEIDESFLLKEIEEKMAFLQQKISDWLTADIREKIVFCFPVESPESWIIAAFDGNKHGDPELILKPADNIIAHSSQYNGIKITRKDGKLKKTKKIYDEFFIPKLCNEWSNVKTICKSANSFECDLTSKLSN